MANLTRQRMAYSPLDSSIFKDVMNKLQSLTDESGEPLFNTVAALNAIPLNFTEENTTACLLNFDEQFEGESTAWQFDENFVWGHIWVYFITYIPQDENVLVDVRKQQRKLHYNVMLNLRYPYPLMDGNEYAPGLMPAKGSNNGYIWYFGGKERNLLHNYDASIIQLGDKLKLEAPLYASSIKLPFFCDMRINIEQ